MFFSETSVNETYALLDKVPGWSNFGRIYVAVISPVGSLPLSIIVLRTAPATPAWITEETLAPTILEIRFKHAKSISVVANIHPQVVFWLKSRGMTWDFKALIQLYIPSDGLMNISWKTQLSFFQKFWEYFFLKPFNSFLISSSAAWFSSHISRTKATKLRPSPTEWCILSATAEEVPYSAWTQLGRNTTSQSGLPTG